MGKTRNRHYTYCPICRKNAHRTSESAYKQRRELVENNLHNTKEGALAVYRCPHGNGWHVGHMG